MTDKREDIQLKNMNDQEHQQQQGDTTIGGGNDMTEGSSKSCFIPIYLITYILININIIFKQ